MAVPDYEAVNHPQHYGGDTIYEAIKVIEAWQLGFCLGNAVKYISRTGSKPGTDALTDLRKARWYLDREISRIEAEADQTAQISAIVDSAIATADMTRLQGVTVTAHPRLHNSTCPSPAAPCNCPIPPPDADEHLRHCPQQPGGSGGLCTCPSGLG